MSARAVLVVEDVPELSHLLSMTLELDDRFTPAASASSADEALRLAAEHRPDGIVLDVSIDGDGDGLDILPTLREMLPDACIVVFTAHGNAHQQHRALTTGATAYVVKDGDLSPLLDALAQ